MIQKQALGKNLNALLVYFQLQKAAISENINFQNISDVESLVSSRGIEIPR